MIHCTIIIFVRENAKIIQKFQWFRKIWKPTLRRLYFKEKEKTRKFIGKNSLWGHMQQ